MIEWYTTSSNHPPKIGAGSRAYRLGIRTADGWDWKWHWLWRRLE